jgi:hypothetical protein
VRATGTGDRLTVQNQGGAHGWILDRTPRTRIPNRGPLA